MGICSSRRAAYVSSIGQGRVESGDGRSRSGLEEGSKGEKWYAGRGLLGFPSVLVPLNKLREAKKKKSDKRLGNCSYRGLLAV
jgi:hypothetical protein